VSGAADAGAAAVTLLLAGTVLLQWQETTMTEDTEQRFVSKQQRLAVLHETA
jgi:hypothetical protein